MPQKNVFLFFILSALILLGWMSLSNYLWPPPPKKNIAEVAKKDKDAKPKNEKEGKAGDKRIAEKKADGGEKTRRPPAEDGGEKPRRSPERIKAADLQQLPATPENKLVRLGARQHDSKFHLYVELDPRSAGVRSVWLNKYQAADNYGRPEWRDAEKKQPLPLALVPPGANARTPSFQLFAYDVHAPNDDQPLDTLARVNWTVVGRKTEEVDGRSRESVSFQAETQGVLVTKTYTLTEGEYHLGLTVALRRTERADKTLSFRYQMTGAHGLPVEGKWYTSIFRNALIARADTNGGIARDLQDLRQISVWGGGNQVRRDPGNDLIYAGVANQYFASVIAVDNEQKHRDFLREARPTLETALTKGTVVSTAEDGASFVLKPQGNEPEQTFYMQAGDLARFPKGARLGVLHHTASATARNGTYPEIATNIFTRPAEEPPAPWVDDITVRVSSEPVELKGDVEVVHKYLLYHGPVKVSQLFPPPGLPSKPLEQGGVSQALFGRYHDALHLNTLTDSHSPGAMGQFANAIYWSTLVIKCTNVMHAVLDYIHAIIPSYGLCIIVLTILVRGMMFPLSRKQALMSVRMQQLMPELKKLQAKYKDDRQALGMAQMELYRKHGVNPFGSCWVLLLQMPVFMGLYFALQESIHFRLAEFWPTWIVNLAAPDMMFHWSEKIPFISRIEDYGSIFYLGPYFNILPILGVVLMIAVQQMMTPPPADEQQAMQQKMMKYMMIFFGLMFYKWPAGLCLYFIASSAWGLCERKLLPKKPMDSGPTPAPAKESYFQKLLRRAQGEQITAVPPHPYPLPLGGEGRVRGTTKNGGFTAAPEAHGRSTGKRRRDKRRQTAAGAETIPDDTSLLGRWRKRLREWWIAVLKEAEKKHRS